MLAVPVRAAQLTIIEVAVTVLFVGVAIWSGLLQVVIVVGVEGAPYPTSFIAVTLYLMFVLFQNMSDPFV